MIYIIIPVHNYKHYTNDCLQCLQKQTCKDFKIIVVDDGSTDGTDVMIKENFPDVILLKGNGKLWWTGATNSGIDWALNIGKESDYLLTLNNDLIVNENYLASLIECAEKTRNSLIGSLSINIHHPDVIEDGGVIINFWTAKYNTLNKGRLLSSLNNKSKNYIEVSALSGRGTLIPFKVFKKIGTYNYHKLPHYGADYEFSIRAKQCGFQLIISYNAWVYSHVDQTGLELKNRLNFFKYFFSIKSPSNMFERINFATCITKNPFMMASYLLFDFIRNTSHYFKLFYFSLSKREV